jgi:trk system potassium uptake protein TrkA
VSVKPVLEPVAVLGLGRFGLALAEALTNANCEVLAVDSNPNVVRALAPVVTLAVEADVTDREALAQLGVAEYTRAVVAIGSHIESSILCASALIDLGVAEIWAKAINPQQARILERIGVPHVVFPELDMGYRLAHTLTGHRSEFIPTIDGFAYAVVPADRAHVGRKLGISQPFGDRGIRVLAVIRGGRGLPEPAAADLVVASGDSLLIAGPANEVEQISP